MKHWLPCCLAYLCLAPLWLAGCRPSLAAVAPPAPTDAPTAVPTVPSQPVRSTSLPLALAPQTPAAEPLPLPTARPQQPAPTAVAQHPAPLSPAEREAMFREVWQTINQHYIYADFGGLDWQALWSTYLPQVRAASSDQAFFDLLVEMVSQLNDHHSRFLPPSDAAAETLLAIGRDEHVGIGVLTVPATDGVMIQQVFEHSPAAQAGLRRRDRIVAVDGRPMVAGCEITGLAGTPVRLTVVRPDNAPREVVLVRQPVQGQILPVAQRLPGDIGYLAIPTLWVSNMHESVYGALNELVIERPLHGLIIDLRGNPGGWRDVLTGILGHFSHGNVGFFFDRQGLRAMTVREVRRPDLRDVRLVVLVDQATASYAEVLAAVLQSEAHAYVIGVPTAGNTETIYAYDLAHGARLWVAQEGFRLRNGEELEGRGVLPNEIVEAAWTQYSDANDPQMLAALRYLAEGTRSPLAPE